MNYFQGNLFTEYFLTEGIEHTHEWKELEKADFKSLFKEFEDIYLKLSSAQNPDEADTEDNLIIRFLEKLGFRYLRQKSPNKKRRQDIPDFILFKDEEDKAEGLKNKTKQWHLGKSILEGKRFKRSLDRRDIYEPFDRGVPSNQILRYLSSVETASNGKILWGILTNGQIWRLYYQKARSRTDDYLGVDLDTIFTNDLSGEKRINAFKIFYLFFRKSAFETTDYRQEKTFLEYALEEGKNWEERVAESLKDKVFTVVFPLLAEGFLQDAKRKEEVINDELLFNIYNNTLILLYRLLFVLYAEDRDLLPVRNPKYDDYSLRKLRNEIEGRIDDNDTFSKTASIFYGYLKSLFNTINSGDKDLGTPPYNGGLFDPQTHSFLGKYEVADYYLAHTIDYLSRDHYITPPKRINYRDLTVRQLGSIYEGLLEFKLTIAPEDLAIIREKGIEKYISKRELKAQKVLGEKKRGELYITNDKADRKATGSYYTPDYIVQYIVENTIGPLVKEKLQNFESRKRELKGSSKFRGQTAKWKTSELKNFDPAGAILNLKILDPAMGSGHFLVGALDYLADRVLEILDQYSQQIYFGKDIYISPLTGKIEDIRSQVLVQAREGGYEIEHDKLEDKHIIKRIILKRCVYGVDLNPLSVELAKVSLWLHSFTVGAPLSFLDHHLKCGNSLIGVWDVSEVILPSAPRYQDFQGALNNMIFIQNLYDISLKETQESARLYSEFEKKLHPFIRKLNVSLAAKHFMEEDSRDAIKMIEGKAFDESYPLHPEMEPKYNEAIYIADKKRFFHWRLEFPEVWYELLGRERTNGGFDVILGNPPWVALCGPRSSFQQPRDEMKYYKFLYHAGRDSIIDTFALFIEKSIEILRHHGYLAYILPDIILLKNYPNIRKYILDNCKILEILECGQPFKEVSLDTIMMIINREAYQKEIEDNKIQITLGFSHYKSVKTKYQIEQNRFFCEPKYKFNIFISNSMLNLKSKLEKDILKLEDCFECHEGIHSGNIRSKLFISQKKLDVDKHLIFGRDEINRYTLIWKGMFVRYDIRIINRAKGEYAGLGKENYFTSEKLLVRRTGDRIMAAYDSSGFFASNNMFVVLKRPDSMTKCENINLKFLSCILNSKIMSSYFNMIQPRKGKLFAELKIEHINQFPIRCIHFLTPKYIRKNLAAKYKILYQQCLSNNKLEGIISFTLERLQAEPEQSDVIHDFLAFLAEQMIECNKEKYHESKGFLDWLKDYLGLKIDEMEKKTKVKAYYNIGWDEFWKILRDNKKKIRFDITRREHVEKIKEEFETSVSKLTPLKNKIELTDKLIDQIVYKLYDLTDEEISIIEKEA